MKDGDGDGGSDHDDGSPEETPVAGRATVDSFAPELAALARTVRLDAPVGRGTLIDGAYRIERAIGEGGMGVVYLARDVRLAREVAIKLGTAVSSAALARASREALALARLSHPNVVAVFEVGQHGGRMFIAMEHVAGGNARQWLAAGARGWREIVALYAAAGDGLAAAHAAGLVHRDFKPDNVLVGDDGRPRVADFGLARDAGADDGVKVSSIPAGSSSVTETGTIVGTPAYMAPEQLAGLAIDARADQFAFCASLWEALFGARPFAGKTPEELGAAIERGEPRASSSERGRRVPRHVIAAITRGLAHDRDARWPSMAALVAALRRDPGARRRRVAIAGAVAIAAASVALLLARGDHGDGQACEPPDAAMRSWSPARQADVRAVLARRAIAAGVAPSLQAYMTAWSRAYRDACRATRVTRAQSEELLDKRMACLDARRARFAATVELLVDPRTEAWRTSELVASLEPVEDCADLPRLGRQVALPRDARARDAVAALRGDYEQVDAMVTAGRIDDARGRLRALVARGRGLAFAPLLAELLYTFGTVEGERDARAGAPIFDEAVATAMAGGDDEIAARALGQRAIQAAKLGDVAGVERAVTLARALVARLGRPAAIEIEVERAAGAAYGIAADYPKARAATARALSLARETHRDDLGLIGELLLQLGTTASRTGDTAAARGHFTEGRDDLVRARGDHPSVSHAYRNLGALAYQDKDVAGARALLQHAVEISRRAGDAAEHIVAIQMLAQILAENGQPAEAEALYREGITVASTQSIGPREMFTTYNGLAMVLAAQGKGKDAVAVTEQAVVAVTRAYDPSNPYQVTARVNLGVFYHQAGDLVRSEAVLREALAIATRYLAEDDVDRRNALGELGQTLLAKGDPRGAAPLFERLVAVSTDPALLAEARVAFAQALDGSGEHARAIEQGKLALAGYAALGPPVESARAEIAAWLRARGVR